MRIDIHTHFQCLDFVKHLQGRSKLPKSLLDGGNYIIQCAAGLVVPSLPKIIDMEEKLRDMEDMKIDVAVLRIGFVDGQRSIREVDRCIKKLGFKGIQVFSNISNKLLDSPEFVPVLKHIG